MQRKTTENASLTSPTDHKHSLENSRLIQVTQKLDASPEVVWRALSDPKLVQQWWGPKNYTCPVAEIDFRIGGKYLMVMQEPNGRQHWSTGRFENIIDQELLVYSDHFANEKGQVISAEEAGLTGDWTKDMFITIELEPLEDDRGTQLLLSHQGIPTEMHDECETSWSECLEKLQQLVERKT